ncbi:hypothetical protein [Chryseobacterium koreense]|uniref:Uncharacterized protein n=1 Tax=Chryseobacterium koreense CCUG 49689 TaxID=1304281 RepID=A0A0J7J360_9FLAO|nr:hypothetical protein [Chryseobacterium koreense]KMQ72474.1 hypothetical protein ACM44_01665 [Chryseobacterium koreense CCUG 49689]MBB5333434.1 hypothetical protein [Chryseobacterium koreense]
MKTFLLFCSLILVNSPTIDFDSSNLSSVELFQKNVPPTVKNRESQLHLGNDQEAKPQNDQEEIAAKRELRSLFDGFLNALGLIKPEQP